MRGHNHAVGALVLVAVALALGGCSDLKTALGAKRTAPDEFAVLARAPLSKPPNYNLRPPAPGSPRPQEQSIQQGAERLVFKGESAGTIGAGTFYVDASTAKSGAGEAQAQGSDAAFQQLFGGDKANPSIRAIVNSETSVYVYEQEYLLEKLLFWKDKPPPGVVLDAKGEQTRLQENAALGRPVSDGETPSVKRREPGILSKLFD